MHYSTKKEEKKRTKKSKEEGEPEVTPVAKLLCEKFVQSAQPTTNLDNFVKV